MFTIYEALWSNTMLFCCHAYKQTCWNSKLHSVLTWTSTTKRVREIVFRFLTHFLTIPFHYFCSMGAFVFAYACMYVCVCVCVRLRGFAWICARPASKLTMTSSVQNLFRFLHDTGQSAAQKKILKAYKAFKSLSSQHVMVSRLFVLQELFTGSLHGLLCPMERVELHNPLRLLPDYDVHWQYWQYWQYWQEFVKILSGFGRVYCTCGRQEAPLRQG